MASRLIGLLAATCLVFSAWTAQASFEVEMGGVRVSVCFVCVCARPLARALSPRARALIAPVVAERSVRPLITPPSQIVRPADAKNR